MNKTKRPFIILLALILINVFSVCRLTADTYVKGKIYFKSSYAYGVTEPDAQITLEWWIGKQKILFTKAALTNSNDYQTDSPLKVLIDISENCFVFLDDDGKSFTSIIQDSVPSQVTAVDTTERFANFKCTGWVKASEETANFLNIACQKVNMNEKVNLKDRVYYDKDRSILVASQLPFDWKPLTRLNLWMHAFFNPDKMYMNQLHQIKGFIMASDDTRYHNGKTITTRFEVLEIKEKKAPIGIYKIPAEYKKTEKLSSGQVWGMFDTLYPWGW